ncbi:clavesin-1-like [Phlebotomus argentipes]|uniref:clavesin-1-like n=1 Tax=Phlebotomus argentipes TaxID=94469 RepID=UPI0028930679|nr:clavesin-1-like [Phlebotomus argentipes]
MIHIKIATRSRNISIRRSSQKMEPPSLDLAKVYENRSPQLKFEDVHRLQEWMKTKKHYLIDLDEIDLINFLHQCDFDVEKAKKRITGATIFQTRARIFQDIDMRSESIKAAMETVLVSHITLKDDNPGMAIFLKVLATDAKQIDAANLIKVMLMYTYLWLRGLEPPADHVIIVDLEVVSVAHLAALDLRTLRELSCFYNHFYFGTLCKVHFINVGSWIDRLLSILKSTMGRDFSEKICVHSNANNLHEFISLEQLPKELGGDFLSFHQMHEAMKELLERHADELLNKYRVQSSDLLHIEMTYNEPDLFGLDGKFRRLDVD